MKYLFLFTVITLSFCKNGNTTDLKYSKNIFNFCSTPNGTIGKCISFDDCDTLYEIFTQQDYTEEDRLYLSKSQCGFFNHRPLVCCPLYQHVDIEKNLLPSEECGRVVELRATNGKMALPDQFPWMALLEYEKDNVSTGFHCGASLISNRYILTAAHCVLERAVFNVRLGEWNLETNLDGVNVDEDRICDCEDSEFDCDCHSHDDYEIEEIIIHEDYRTNDRNRWHDIALIRLNRNVTYSDFVKPICLPFQNELQTKFLEGQRAEVAGWGITASGKNSNILQSIITNITPQSECKESYKTARIALEPFHICAKIMKGQDTCNGDSGGPLMMLTDESSVFVAAGIVSFGRVPCGLTGWSSVYTRVNLYSDWIKSKLRY